MPVSNVKSNWESGDLVFRNAAGTEIGRFSNSAGMLAAGGTFQKRVRVATADVNSGATLVAAVPGYAIRVVDWTMIAIGGNAQTATSVDLIGTRSSGEVRIAVVAVAALTRSAAVKPNSSNVTLLADGASHTALDANTALTIGKQSGGSNLATSTHVDVILTYALDAA